MKQNADPFSSYHPLINFLYFSLVLVFSMFFMHPLCLGLSLCAAVTYSIYLHGRRAVRRNLLFLLPLLLITALLNPAFNHAGVTVLCYLPNGNPLTSESIYYGIAAGTMLAAVICWFFCYNVIMTSDKFVYLFGRVIPALSLVLSMSLRFVPRFTAQLKVVTEAQRALGWDVANGSLWQRAKQGLTILSILITWSLENAIELSDSMRSRGYGLPGRTAFSIYRWSARDSRSLLFLLSSAGYVLAGKLTGALHFRYFPSIEGIFSGVYPLSVFFVYFVLLLFPLLLDLAADCHWKRQEKTACL